MLFETREEAVIAAVKGQLRRSVENECRADNLDARQRYLIGVCIADYGGDEEEAEQEFAAAVAIARVEDQDRLPEYLIALGDIMTKRGEFDGADAVLGEALTLERATASSAVRLANAESAMGALLAASGKLDNAEKLLVSSYASLDTELGGRHTSTRQAIARLVTLYQMKGESDTSREFARLLNSD